MIPRQDRFQETMETFTSEFNMGPSQEMDSMMSMMRSQINRAISAAIAERAIPEIQNIVSSMSSSGNKDTEASLSPNSQENTEKNNGFKYKITKRTRGLPVILETTGTVVLTNSYKISATEKHIFLLVQNYTSKIITSTCRRFLSSRCALRFW